MFCGEPGGQVLFKGRYWKRVEASRALLLSKFLQELPLRKKSLTAQGDSGKIIDVVGRKICRLRVYLGNVRKYKKYALCCN